MERKSFCEKLNKYKHPLSFAHKFIIGILLFLSFLFILFPQHYKYAAEVQGTAEFSFLQAGDYSLCYELAFASSDNVLSIYSGGTVDSNNHVGVMIVRQDIPSEAVQGQLSFHVEQDMRNVVISTSAEHCLAHIDLQSIQLLYNDSYLLAFLGCVLALFVFIFGHYANLGQYKMPLLALCFGLLASFPMANGLFLGGHDSGIHIARIESIYRGLCAGELPVRIGSAHQGGFGSLFATMYPQLFLYPFALLRFTGASLMLCYKLLIVSLNIACSLLSYYSLKNICRSEKTGILMSMLYTFSIYRLLDVYVRGAIGESLAMTFLPLLLWGIYEVLWGNYKKWWLLALGVSAILQSHVLSVEMCAVFLVPAVIFWCFKGERKDFFKRLMAGIKAAVFTLLLNASFLVPFLFFCGEDLQCFHLPNEISDSVLYFNQMFFSFANASGGNLPPVTLAGDMSFTVGGILLLGSLLFLAASCRVKEQVREVQIGRHCLIYGCFALFLASWLVPWDSLCKIKVFDLLASSLQFSWRFLGIASVLLCTVSAIGIKMFEEKISKNNYIYVAAVLILFLATSYFFEMCFSSLGQTDDKMKVNGYDDMDSLYLYYDGESFKLHHLNYTYEDAYIQTLYAEAEFSQFTRKGSGLSVTVTPLSETEGIIIFPIYYYPGYEVSVNGETVGSYSYENRLAIDMPLGKAAIEVRYAGLPVFRIGDLITLITAAVCCFYLIWTRIIRCRYKSFPVKT